MMYPPTATSASQTREWREGQRWPALPGVPPKWNAGRTCRMIPQALCGPAGGGCAPSTGASRSCSTQREVNMPHSTAGPSGPRLHPEPSVATAAAVRPTEASGRGRAPLVASATWPARFGPSPAGPHAARNAATARPPAPGRTKVYHGRMAASDAAIPNCTAGSPYSALATASTDALNVATPSPVSAPVSAAPPSRPANARSE